MSDGLRNSGIPLGGLGTGSLELRSDGFFHEWQIMNNGPWGSGPELDAPLDTLYFGMQVISRSQKRSALLGLPPARNQNLNDPYHLPWIEHPAAIDAQTRFPFTTLDYRLERFPLRVSLEAFSPFIPHDSRHSALPAALCTFTLTNAGSERAEVALFGALRNLVGYTRLQCSSSISFEKRNGRASLLFEREDMPRKANDGGAMVLGSMAGARPRLSFVSHPRSSRDIWEPLRESAALESTDLGTFAAEIGNVGASHTARLRQGLPHGVLCQTIRMAAGATARLGFVLTWHFPNFAERDYEPRKLKGRTIGHRYAEWYENATAVYEDVVRTQRNLTSRTRAFTDAYYSGTQPQWLLDAVAAQLTTFVKSSWWARDGRFGIWEGLGCCGLQTTDVSYYGSFPVVQFFPDIEQSQMRLTRAHIDSTGNVPHMMPGSFSCADVDRRGRIDLIPQFVLLVWRDVLWTGDLNYGREMWPAVRQALETFQRFDTDGDGLPNNRGPDQTYDQFPLKGTSAFVGFLYAASLRAAASLADLLGHECEARALRVRLDAAMPLLDEQLWNGTYYRLCYDPVDRSANEGVMADQVNADWFVRQTTGSPLLPPNRTRSALTAVLQHCSSPHAFITNCAWPSGGAVSIGRHTADQANWPWSGVEYTLAAHLALIGKRRDALRVARDVWERYERAGLRFNHIECGGHYYRALSAWAFYLALTGFAIDAPSGTVTIRIDRNPAQFVLCTAGGWGMAATRTGKALFSLTVHEGAVRLRRLALQGVSATAARATLRGKRIASETESVRSTTTVDFGRSMTLGRGTTLWIDAGA